MSPSEPPKLGISHLLLITICIAGFLASSTSLFGSRFGAWQVWYAVQDGLWLAGIIMLLAVSIRGYRPVLRHPGHWLLITEGLFHLVGFPVQLLTLALNKYFDTFVFLFPTATAIAWIQVAFCVVATVANRSLPWRSFFLAQTTFVFLEAVGLTCVMLDVTFGMSVSIERVDWVNSAYRPLVLGTQLSAVLISVCERFARSQRRDSIH